MAKRSEQSFKSFFTPGMLFEAFRFSYIGPVPGHDIKELKRHLHMAALVEDRPVLLHVLTRKGKGYPPAEANPAYFHGVGGFEPETGLARAKKQAPPGFTAVFGDTLCELAEKEPRLTVITAAMPEGTGTSRFQERFPERFVDVGICEQHAVTFAAGLAKEGLKPVVAVYSTFLQRGYDQIVHDVCIQKLPVVFCIDRAGLVGEDGPTHHGVFDIAFLRHIPHMSILAPRDEDMLRRALATALACSGPVALRYPRGAGYGVPMTSPLAVLPAGRGEMLATGGDALIIALGSRVHPALEAAQRVREETGKQAAVFDPVWVKPSPEEELLDLAARHTKILLVEEGCLAGGFSSAVLELWSDHGVLQGRKIRRLGVPDAFVEHGSQQELRVRLGLCAEGIAAALKEMLTD
jgi:1-deoxy-D-xylulose-5-phosphate synthase